MSSKKSLRKEMLQKRRNLTEQEIKTMSQIIVDKVRPLLKGRVGMFYPIQNEVDLLRLLNDEMALPKIDGDMHFHLYEGEFVKGEYNIPEPTGDEVIVDTLLVPGSVYDLNGYRIGYGGGYYDKYMTDNHLKIGICFDFQVIDKLPKEEHDVQLDLLVTEKRTISFKLKE